MFCTTYNPSLINTFIVFLLFHLFLVPLQFSISPNTLTLVTCYSVAPYPQYCHKNVHDFKFIGNLGSQQATLDVWHSFILVASKIDPFVRQWHFFFLVCWYQKRFLFCMRSVRLGCIAKSVQCSQQKDTQRDLKKHIHSYPMNKPLMAVIFNWLCLLYSKHGIACWILI